MHVCFLIIRFIIIIITSTNKFTLVIQKQDRGHNTQEQVSERNKYACMSIYHTLFLSLLQAPISLLKQPK
jgi:hypothetical protein